MTVSDFEAERANKAERFLALHERAGAFVIPNPWNAGSARILAARGFEALATTSAGLAFSIGKLDSAGGIDLSTGLSREEVLANAAEIAEATDLPVSGDLEGGYGDTPDDVAKTIVLAIGAGLAGGSIEDATGRKDSPFFSREEAIDRMIAARHAALDRPFVLTARTENYLYGNPDLKDTIGKLQAFQEAGADVLFAPGMTDLEEIRTLCREVDRPVNVLMGIKQPTFSVAELQEAGAKRISVGGGLARAAMKGFLDAVDEIVEDGTFTYSARIISNNDAVKLTAKKAGGDGSNFVRG